MRAAVFATLAFVMGATGAQVRSVEPFGGRPFGSDAVVQPVLQPAPVAPPTIVMQPGSTAVLGNTAPPAVVQQAAPAPAVAAPAPTAAPPQQPVATGTPPAAATAAQPQPVTPPFTGPRAATAAPPAAAASGAGQPLRGMPPDAPRMVVSGSTYSSDPTKRLLIVNGLVMREGADLGGGVVLEQVKRDGAVMGFRGARYNVVF